VIRVLVCILACILLSACSGGTSSTVSQSDSPTTAAQPDNVVTASSEVTASFPNSPPPDSNCPGSTLAHADIRHPRLGPVRIFLTASAPDPVVALSHGCVVAITGTGTGTNVASIPIVVAADTNNKPAFAFANPATDSTSNTFLTYETVKGTYAVIVLIPSDAGFRDTKDAEFSNSKVQGPDSSGQYAIEQTRNECEPDCADGKVTEHTLHWNGQSYVENSADSGSAPAATTTAGCDSRTLVPLVLASPDIALAKSLWGDLGLTELQCESDWAMAHTAWTSPDAQNASVLFHRVDGVWRYVTVGGTMPCVELLGVPADVAAKFKACH
jgi:hypothetical protein